MNETQKLIFVYNADSSLFNQVGDLIHKTISPKTYQCRLCGLTYSGVSMNKDWRDFIQSLHIKAEFLHKDEFTKTYPEFANSQFPAVFIKTGQEMRLFISSREINQQQTLEALRNLVQTKTSKL